MSNTYFQFKQFRVDQQHCAMKVCTDGCLQGAYAVSWIKKAGHYTKKGNYAVLDIGTGTGLLSLMLAQELPDAVIDAVEFDEGAYLQAVENVAASPWPERIRVLREDIRAFDSGKKYDFVICNPPFYDNDLKSKDENKNAAKHGITLNYHDLIDTLKDHLSSSGIACVMLPPKQFKTMEQIAMDENLYPMQIVQVRQSVHSGIFRIIGFLGRINSSRQDGELCIRKEKNENTDAFKNLLKDFYLNF